MTGSASISASISLISFSLETSVVVVVADFGGSVVEVEVVVEVALVLDDVSWLVELSAGKVVDEVKVVEEVKVVDDVEDSVALVVVELSGSLSVADVDEVVEVS